LPTGWVTRWLTDRREVELDRAGRGLPSIAVPRGEASPGIREDGCLSPSGPLDRGRSADDLHRGRRSRSAQAGAAFHQERLLDLIDPVHEQGRESQQGPCAVPRIEARRNCPEYQAKRPG